MCIYLPAYLVFDTSDHFFTFLIGIVGLCDEFKPEICMYTLCVLNFGDKKTKKIVHSIERVGLQFLVVWGIVIYIRL